MDIPMFADFVRFWMNRHFRGNHKSEAVFFYIFVIIDINFDINVKSI